MLSKDVQEQIVTKTHQAPSNPNISDTWIHEQVPVLADAVQVCKQADLQILTLYSVLPAKTSAQLEQQLEELLRGKDVQQSVVSIIWSRNANNGKNIATESKYYIYCSAKRRRIVEIAQSGGGFFFRPRSKKHNLSAKCFMAFFFFRS